MGRPRGITRAISAISLFEFETLIDYIRATKRHALRNEILMRLVYEGLKPIEVCNLKVEDIFGKKGILDEVKLKYGTRERKVRLTYEKDVLGKMLNEYILTLWGKYGNSYSKKALLFRTQKGNFSPNSLQELIRKLFKIIKLDEYTSESLRLGYAVKMFGEGKSDKDIAMKLGDENTPRVLRKIRMLRKASLNH